MAVTAFMYPQNLITTYSKESNWAATDVIKCALTNTAYTYVNTHKYYSNSGGFVGPTGSAFTELATANGYTATGVTITQTLNAISTQTFSWTATNAVWTASGAGISAVAAVVYNSSPGTTVQPLMSYVQFGGTVTAAAGATLTIAWNASGIISIVVA